MHYDIVNYNSESEYTSLYFKHSIATFKVMCNFKNGIGFKAIVA